MPKNVLFRKQIAPIGTISVFSGGTVPSDWVLAYGQTLLIVDYPKLFEIIGTQYGGDGITTFGLPDYRGRTAVGKDNGAGRITSGGTGVNADSGIDGETLGAAGGSQTHTLSKTELVRHGHPWRYNFDTLGNNNGGLMRGDQLGTGNAAEWTGTPSTTAGRQIGGTGSGQTHQNTQPSIICNYIIKVA